MIHDLLDDPLGLAGLGMALVLVSLVSARAGWSLKSWFARRREVSLQSELRSVRTAAPALAATVRTREETIRQLQAENRDLRAGFAHVEQGKSDLERQHQGLLAKVRKLTDELTALRGGREDGTAIELDDPRASGEHPDDDPAELAARLRRAEIAYGRLQSALLEKSSRISSLEAEIDHLTGSTNRHTHAEFEALAARLRSTEAIVAEQLQKITVLEGDKATLESLAQRRSQTNRTIKDAGREAEARNRTLATALAEAQRTIDAREASIHRLLQDVRDTRDALREAHAEAADLRRQDAERETTLVTLRSTLQALEASQKDGTPQVVGQGTTRTAAPPPEKERGGPPTTPPTTN